MPGDYNQVDTALLVQAANDVAAVRKNIAASVEELTAVLRKLLESNAGEAGDELDAVNGQLRKSSADIINTLSKYEMTLGEIAGIYDTAEKQTASSAVKLKFGGLR